MAIDPNDQLLSRDDIGRKHLESDNVVVITPRELSLHLWMSRWRISFFFLQELQVFSMRLTQLAK